MNFKKILSSALTVVMIFTAIATFIPAKAEAAYSPSVNTESKYTAEQIKKIVQDSYQYGSGKFAWNNVAEALEYEMDKGYLDYVNSPGNKYTLYVNRYTGVFYYENNATGEILTSNPYNLNVDGVSEEIRYLLSSQIQITFFETANTSNMYEYFSSKWAAEYAQIFVSPISGGLRVNYTLGDTSTRFLIPGQITSEKFLKNILKPMLENYSKMLNLYVSEKYPDENFDFFEKEKWGRAKIYLNECVNQQAIREYCTYTQSLYNKAFPNRYCEERKTLDKMRNEIIMLTNKYTLLNPIGEKNEGRLENMYKLAPLTKEGIPVYTFKGTSISDQRIYSNIVRRNCPNYTFQDMYEDEAECGYIYEKIQKPVFRCSLEYTFNEDNSLSVRLPANSISFDETLYTLLDITPLRFFGAGNLTEDGYIFIPDGSGSVIEYDEFYNSNDKQNVSLNLSTYGRDYCYSTITGAHREPVIMPVYGVLSTENATPYSKSLIGKDKVKNGYFAILEEGSSLANLHVNFGGYQHRFSSAYAVFNPYPSDTFDLSDTISVSGATQYTMVSESKYTGSYITRYVMLSNEELATAAGIKSYSPTYTGMANYYRNYLKENGELKPLQNLNEKLPLYIEALGSMERVKKILTFPVSVAISLTEFDDIATMYSELADAKNIFLKKAEEYQALADDEEKDMNQKQVYLDKAASYRTLSQEIYDITNINFRLTGFANGGMYFKYPTKVKWEKVCGGKKAFGSLISKAKETSTDGSHFGIYPEFDFLYISNMAMFDGVSTKKNVSRMVDNRYASKQVYNSVNGEYESIFSMIISSDTLDELFAKFHKAYSKYDINTISVSTLGSDVNSNFNEKNPINREESRQNIISLLDKMAIENDYSVMTNVGNIYTVKYTEHIVDLCTDSSHYRYASYSVPFVGMVLHSYVNYAGGASNYSGSPDYDMLHAIENGASLYYILCFRNTNFMKDDLQLNKYYGVSYENWYDKIVKQYAILNKAIGDLQNYEIVDHRTIIGERIIDDSEIEIKEKLLIEEFLKITNDQIQAAVDKAFDDMFGNTENLGRGVKINVDKDALIAQASDILNISKDNLNKRGFITNLNAIVDKFLTEYPGLNNNAYVVNFSQVDYSTKYNYVTDSFAEDENYVKTDYTVDNNLISMVTYRNSETGDTVKFILNYNIYSVTVRLDENHIYNINKYGFIRIDD